MDLIKSAEDLRRSSVSARETLPEELKGETFGQGEIWSNLEFRVPNLNEYAEMGLATG